MSSLIEIRCCCKAENLMGFISEEDAAGKLVKRELEDGTFAFSADDLEPEELKTISGFRPNEHMTEAGKKTWKKEPKTWKGK